MREKIEMIERPNAFRLNYLAIMEILGDKNSDLEEVAHRDWLMRRLDEETRKVASIPRKLKAEKRRITDEDMPF